MRLFDAAFELDRVGAGGDRSQALGDHGPRQDGGRGRAVAGDIVGLGGDLFDQLGTDVLLRLLEIDLASHGDAVVGDRRGTERAVDDDIASSRAERGAHGVCHRIDAMQERVAGVFVKRR